ncbi:MAG: phosphate ABC transporter substrate-binding protein [Ignavibacteriaceae bacterium]|nr:phosphate ABC transporter substrate-binding protein [Ignavibacteriaceae bacterium]
MKFLSGGVILILLSLIINGCKLPANKENVVRIKGPDTMVRLTQMLAREYMKTDSAAVIQVAGGGSGTGVAALINGTADIATISREIHKNELTRAIAEGHEFKVDTIGIDALVVVVNAGNKIPFLTISDLKNIFTGKSRNFESVGGPDLEITPYGRENSSGTYEFFKEHVLKGSDFAPSVQVLQGTAALADAVSKDKKGIAYGGIGHFMGRKDVRIVPVKISDKITIPPGGLLTPEAIKDGPYSLKRYIYLISDSKGNKKAADFIGFVKSPEGQKIVKQLEFIPLY